MHILRHQAGLALVFILAACAVTETGTPGADPSVDVPPSTIEATQLPDDPVSPYVAVEVRVARDSSMDFSNVVWTQVATGELTEAELVGEQYAATLSFVAEEPGFRLSAWSDDLDSIAIADLRFDFASQSWVSVDEPCVRWSNRALRLASGMAQLVGIENRCDEARSIRYRRAVPSADEERTLELGVGEQALVQMPSSSREEGPRAVWQLEPGAALLDVFTEFSR